MILKNKKQAFVELGKFLKQFSSVDFQKDNTIIYNQDFYSIFENAILNSENANGWFTKEQVVFAINNWSNALTIQNLDTWLNRYNLDSEPLKKVALILAGNIPMVGFHDILSVLISGNKALIKFSSNDDKLTPILLDYLIKIEPKFADRIEIITEKIENFDAVIATGSNNTSRYFEYYFGKYPNIIRKNRNSVAVLDGTETKNQLLLLGEDIFRYYGLGCRNVSKLFVPKGYDFKDFFENIFPYGDIIHYEKYANNYDYNKAVFLMSEYKILDNGFLTIKEDEGYSSPISSVFYQYYEHLNEVKEKLAADKDKIQCVVSNNLIENSIDFGKTQMPNLWDYADDIDTIEFLTTKLS